MLNGLNEFSMDSRRFLVFEPVDLSHSPRLQKRNGAVAVSLSVVVWNQRHSNSDMCGAFCVQQPSEVKEAVSVAVACVGLVNARAAVFNIYYKVINYLSCCHNRRTWNGQCRLDSQSPRIATQFTELL